MIEFSKIKYSISYIWLNHSCDILVLRERGVFTRIAIVHSKMFKELINIVALRKQYCMSF